MCCNFEGRGGASDSKVHGYSAIVCTKMAEPIEMPFGLWAGMVPRKHVLDGDPDPPWIGVIKTLFVMAALRSRCGHYIFCLFCLQRLFVRSTVFLSVN